MILGRDAHKPEELLDETRERFALEYLAGLDITPMQTVQLRKP